MERHRFFTFLFAVAVLLIMGGCSARGPRQIAVAPPPPPPPPLASNVPWHPSMQPSTLGLIPEPQFDPVEETIQRAEAAFRQGEKNYGAGHLERAKQEFNASIATILQAPARWREDQRLQKTFDSLVDRIYTYELEALKQGDGFAEPTYQPAPLDEMQSLTFSENPPVSEEIKGEAAQTASDLPLVINAQVASFIKYFTTGRGRTVVEYGLQSSGRFRDVILRILEEEKVPQDLIYLAQAESAFRPLARSRAGALGVWQFMPSRGKEYGLSRNWWVDERMNPEKATRAAAQHLKDLYAMFGDWYLAMAAYNCGPICVQRAVERTGYADFWQLSARRVLPPETRNYVPIILALTIIGKNAEKYGFDEVLPEEPWVYDTVTVTHPVDLRLVAEITGSSVETIKQLNPSLLRMTTPNVPQYSLRIPPASKEIFSKRIAMIPPEKWVWWRWHAVRYGETLSGIARQYRTSVKAITEVNNWDPEEPLQEAAELIIPVTSGGGGRGGGPGPGTRHVVKSGETLSSIAQRYRVTTEQLMAWNNLQGTRIRVGETLVVLSSEDRTPPSASSQQASSTSRTSSLVHRVRRGESLWQIAINYNVSVELLKRNNTHLNGILRVGDRVVIPPSR